MKDSIKASFSLILIFTTLLACRSQQVFTREIIKADVIVYGGTSSAVITAVQVAKMGKTVVMVSPDQHLGGLSSSGLGYTDVGNKSVVGGLSREFYHRVFQYYQKPETWKWQKSNEYGNVGQSTIAMDTANSTMWIFEPHIAEQVFEDFVKEFNIRVCRNEWLDRGKGVKLKNGKIQSIKTLSGQVYQGKIFVDATYEGDLMAAAGVHYAVGRESNSVYHEKWNGIQPNVFHHGHNFGKLNISPYVIPGDPSSGILRGISGEKPGDMGDGDKKVQAYCYRMCLTTNDKNRIPFEKPEGYDPAQYELLLRVFNAGWRETFEKFDPIPNLKTDVNNHGPISFDYIGMNYDYPEASYEQRKEIIDEHKKYQQGWLYFIANDPRVPLEVQSKMKTWGLSKDEFIDNGNWPYQIYVREARRMIGETVMTENEIQGKNPVADPIGMGSYTMDSHNTQRYITAEGYVQNEGDIGIHPKTPYKISLGTILPKKEECSNLLVTLAVSSSHIAFGSIRMEPVFMVLGQSAGIVAGMALDKNVEIHDLPFAEIKTKLLENGQVLEKQNR